MRLIRFALHWLALASLALVPASAQDKIIGGGVFKPASGGGGSFSPSSITGLVAWYDPSDLSTMFQNSNGTTAVAADGDRVCYIADKSGNGYNATRATTTECPTYKTSGGLHWLDFDGGDSLSATIPNGTLGGNVSKTFYMEYKRDSGSPVTLSYGGGPGGGSPISIRSDGTNDIIGEWSLTDVQVARSTTNVEMWTGIKNGNNLELRVNGASVAGPTATGGAANITTDNFCMGNWGFGCSGGSFDGRLYGVIIATGVSPSQAQTETWLGAKGGQTL